MKYSININQRAFVEVAPELDIKDALIISFLKDFCGVDDKRIKQMNYEEDGKVYRYTWINLKHLIKEMPLLAIKDIPAISVRISKIEKAGFIKKHLSPDNSLYIRLTEKIKGLDFETPVPSPIIGFQGKPLFVNKSTNNIQYKQDDISKDIASNDADSTSLNEKKKQPREKINVVMSFFKKEYKERLGQEPVIEWGKDTKVISDRLNLFSPEYLCDVIARYRNSKKCDDLGFTLTIALSQTTIALYQAGSL